MYPASYDRLDACRPEPYREVIHRAAAKANWRRISFALYSDIKRITMSLKGIPLCQLGRVVEALVNETKGRPRRNRTEETVDPSVAPGASQQ